MVVVVVAARRVAVDEMIVVDAKDAAYVLEAECAGALPKVGVFPGRRCCCLLLSL